jgi:hypothetical protein
VGSLQISGDARAGEENRCVQRIGSTGTKDYAKVQNLMFFHHWEHRNDCIAFIEQLLWCHFLFLCHLSTMLCSFATPLLEQHGRHHTPR